MQSAAPSCTKDVSDDTWIGHFSSFVPIGEFTMPHRRISGAKVRSHKIGIGKTRFAKGKQARLHERKLLMDFFRLNAAEAA